MTEILTQADVETLIGWGIGAFGIGYCAGRVLLWTKRFAEML